MKFSKKLLLALSLTTLCLAIAPVFAQTSSITNVVSPTTANLNSVFIVNNITTSPNDLTKLDAWAVGDTGTIIKWNGTGWATIQNRPTTSNLNSVFFNDSKNGWAVGGNATNGIILQFTNSTWKVWQSGGTNTTQNILNATLYSITMDSSGLNGWAVGANGSAFGLINGTCFAVPTGTNATLRSVGMAHNSTQAWAVGDNGTALTFNNATGTGGWTKMTTPTNATLYGIQVINATSAWAVGGNATSGTILSLNGATWTSFNKINMRGMNTTNTNANDKINGTLYSINANNGTSAWAVGANGTVLYWGGTQWDGQTGVATADLKGVSMIHGNLTSIGQAWAVGTGGKIIAWTGATWIPEIPLIAVPAAILGVGAALAIIGKTRLYRKIPLF